MGFDQGEIIVDSPTGAYFAGQYVDGRLVFELQKVKKFRGIYITVKGFCKVHWTTRHSRQSKVNNRRRYYTVNHDAYEEYITLNMYLVGSKNAEHTLDPGKYEYPFKFQLPATCPSSFEGSVGHVRYELRAVMDIPYAIDEEVFRDIRVLAALDLNAINCKEPASFDLEQTYCCWCCTSGVSETVVKIPVRGYCPGQVVPVELSCRNRSTVEINYISVNIKKKVTYRAQSTTTSEETVVVEMKKGLIPPHTDRLWKLDMAIPDMDILNLDTCSIIDINYSFNVTVSPSECHTDDDDSCQIYFGTVPLVGFSYLPETGQDLTQQKNMNPPAYAPFPQPIINQPVPVNPSYQPNSPFPPNPYPSNSPYPSPNPQPMSPYPNNYPYPNNESPNPPHLSPYPPNNAPYPNNPSPVPSPRLNRSPYPIPENVENTSPYPSNNSPYPRNNSPYPSNNSSYPSNNSPYPGPNPPYPMTSPGKSAPYPTEDKEDSSPSVPLLPPGSVPYPIGQPSLGRSSPFAGASAPDIAAPTPDNEQKKPFDDDQINSPFNPAFMEGKKETPEDK